MKIGIMSMQRVVNYGSYLQAYGLKKTLESMGHSVEFVDYKVENTIVPEKKPALSKNRIIGKAVNAVKLLSPQYRKWRQDQIRSNQSFSVFYNKFTSEFLPELGVDVSKQNNETSDLDALVIGSDEVFNCTQTDRRVGYSRQLFGKDCKAKKLISYAASFGSTTLEKLHQYGIAEEIKEYLEKFDALSVRDLNSFGLIQNLCGIEAEQNIDPVLLYDFPEADKMQVDRHNYIVVYAYAGRISEEEADWIKRFAKKKGKRLISLGFWQTFCDECILSDPLETLAYVRDADYVITDTFHGAVFSIKYQKQFAAIVRESNQQKLTDLLKRFGLEERRVQDLREMERILEKDVDREYVRRLIKQKQQEAKSYLMRELS